MAALLCAALCAEWTAFAATASGRPKALIVKYASPAISDSDARERFAAVTATIGRRLLVQPTTLSRTDPDRAPELPEIDDRTLRSVSAGVSEAGGLMERMENREASAKLAALEARLREFRFGSATLPLLADISLKRGVISLWEGDPAGAAAFLARARTLRPGFRPDPALYSPRFREVWESTREAPQEVEVLMESVPPGARVRIDGEERGSTPVRVRVPSSAPVRVRAELEGYRPAVRSAQWLPGDTGRLEMLLDGDRDARLARTLARSDGNHAEAVRVVEEILGEAGADRVAFLLLERDGEVERLRLLEASAGRPEPRLLGSIDRVAGEGASEGWEKAAALLAAAGWPAPAEEGAVRRRPWYYSWWFLTGLGVLAAGAAVVLNGGGGDGGASGTTAVSSGVNF